MENFINRTLGVILCFGLLASLTYCESEDDLEDTGGLSINITDNPVDDTDILSVNLSVSRIDVHSAYAGWITVRTFDEPLIFNLLDLQNGKTLLLAEQVLPAGIYTEIRLVLEMDETYIEFKDGVKENLMVASGSQSGYKVKGGFKIQDNSPTNLVIDWDLRKSIVEAGNSGNFILKPIMRMILLEEAATIKGNFISGSANQKIVYVYRKDVFSEEETSGYAGLFNNAVNSTKIDIDNNFAVHFLNRGTYDLIFTEYNEEGEFIKILNIKKDITVAPGEEVDVVIEDSPQSG